MVILTAKTLALVISAIKELREMKGSTSREILNYITSTYSIPLETARRQMQVALKRGIAYGILKKNGIHYSLPTDTQAECEEIATQELGLLDRYCRRRQRRKRRGCKPRRRVKRKSCKCKKKRRSSRRRSRCKPRRSRRRKCSCKKRRNYHRRRSISPLSKIENLSLKPTIENNDCNECENSSHSSIPSVGRRDHDISLSY
ncbi:histone H1, gonadal-like [Vespa mandarinia]|uniref:histone H1, gonadal-like n=1 Tax=Vespa mandarinia TaxID=7446 RepID=UPI00161BFF90|nr:histone H1, gonadal-like [Vespa mandarinia]